ncbi:MAG: hypothetical protein CYPHOPRED_004428, partial [Cyphobasidiales sp. Tagirdzhanova-0007]
MAAESLMKEHSAPAITLDTLLNVLNRTLLSPGCIIIIAFFTFYGQRSPTLYVKQYLWMCCLVWLLPWSSRVWENKSWRYGWRGLAGLNRLDWSTQIVLVTGGKQGLGKCIVDLLITKKAKIVVLDRTLPESLPSSDNVYFYKCDVSRNGAVQDVAKRIQAEVGNPTILINNAGVVSGRPILELSEQEVLSTFSINAIAHFWIIKAFLPHMLTCKTGHIVSIASILGQLGVNNMTDYCASKHAILGMHDALRSELSNLLPQFDPPHPCYAKSHSDISEPQDIARAIVDSLDREEGGILYLPKLVGVGWIWRGLPSWASDGLRWISESDSSMMDFHSKVSPPTNHELQSLVAFPYRPNKRKTQQGREKSDLCLRKYSGRAPINAAILQGPEDLPTFSNPVAFASHDHFILLPIKERTAVAAQSDTNRKQRLHSSISSPHICHQGVPLERSFGPVPASSF